jgi:hypothetical protein
MMRSLANTSRWAVVHDRAPETQAYHSHVIYTVFEPIRILITYLFQWDEMILQDAGESQ